MSLKEFVKELSGSRTEGELIRTMFYSLITSIITLGLAYFVIRWDFEKFLSTQAYYLFFAIVGYALLIPSMRQVRSYGEMPCMSGMMIGMTIGMISGFISGFFIASTNGMFVGSVFGMFVGIIFGVWNGKCCGIMGFMEGIMAGFMGGLMGAMTAFMLLNDHLKATAIIVFVVSTVIIFSLNYLVYREMKETTKQIKEDHFLTVVLSFALTMITTWLMISGPRSGVFG